MGNMQIDWTEDYIWVNAPATTEIEGNDYILDVGNFRRVQGIIQAVSVNINGGTDAAIYIESSSDKAFSTRDVNFSKTDIDAPFNQPFNIADDDGTPMYRYLRWRLVSGDAALDIQFRIRLLLKR